jgi:hypothetical protein
MLLSLEIIEKHSACKDGIEWYKKNKEPDTVELCVNKLLKDEKCSTRLDWSNWLLSKMLESDDKIRYAIFAAEQVLDIFEKWVPGDLRPRKAIEAVEEYLKNPTQKNKDATRAARAAWSAMDAARAAGDAARAAWSAMDAARAAWSAGAAGDAMDAARAAWSAGAAGDAAMDAARAAGAAMLEKIIQYGLTLCQ